MTDKICKKENQYGFKCFTYLHVISLHISSFLTGHMNLRNYRVLGLMELYIS